MPLDSSHWAVGYLAKIGDFDPMRHWDRVNTPAVFIYGGADSQIRVDASIERLRASPAASHFAILTFGANGHALFREDVVAFLVAWARIRGTDR
jgi:hypothetical protein